MSITKILLDLQDVDKRNIVCYDSLDSITRITYKDLFDDSLRLLNGLIEKGVKPGDEVVIMLSDISSYLKCFWACVLGGFISVPANADRNYLSNINNFMKYCNNPFYLTGSMEQRD